MSIPSIPSVPLCRTKEVLELPAVKTVKKSYQITISYTEQREMGFIESIFSAIFLWFDPNYFTVKKSCEETLTLENEKIDNVRFKIIPTTNSEESIKLIEKTHSIFLGKNVNPESVQYTITLNPPRSKISHDLCYKPYNSRSNEVLDFADIIANSANLSESYSKEDLRFMEKKAIPTLLAARDILLMKSNEYKTIAGRPSTLPKEFVISSKRVPGQESKSLVIDTSSLSPRSFIRRRLEQGDVFSVKLKADGTFVFSIPTAPIPSGATKKIKIKIISSVDHPNHFKEIAKASIIHEKRSDSLEVSAFHEEMSILPNILPPSARPILRKTIVDPTTFASERIVKAYFEPAVAASIELDRIESKTSFTLEEAALTFEEQFNFLEDLVIQVDELHSVKNVVHHDIKPANLLILSPTREGERRTLQINDFDCSKHTGEVIDGSELGTDGFYVKGLPGDIEKDKYAIGIVLKETLDVLSTMLGKIDSTDERKTYLFKLCILRKIQELRNIEKQLTDLDRNFAGRAIGYANTRVRLDGDTEGSIKHQLKTAREHFENQLTELQDMSNEDICYHYLIEQLDNIKLITPKNQTQLTRSINQLKSFLDEIPDLHPTIKLNVLDKISNKLSTYLAIYNAVTKTISYLNRRFPTAPRTEAELEARLSASKEYINSKYRRYKLSFKQAVYTRIIQNLKARRL